MREPRILVIRFSAIGDCVMAAHAVTALRLRHPEAFLLWAVEGRCAPVVDRHRLVSQRYEVPRDKWKADRWSMATWRDQLAKYTRLRSLRFDRGVDLQGHLKTAMLLRLAKPRERISVGATDALSARLNPVAGGRPEGMHHVEWQNAVISRWEPLPIPGRPIIPENEHPREADFATICTGASHPERLVDPAHWAEVARALQARGMRVAFLGGPKDARPEVEGALDLVGKLRLKESAAWVRRSAVHLAGDTGLGHIAAAMGTPVVTVFGPQDPRVFRPWTERGRVLQRDGDPNAVTPAEIVAAAEELTATWNGR